MTPALSIGIAAFAIVGAGFGIRTILRAPKRSVLYETASAIVLGIVTCGAAAPLFLMLNIPARGGIIFLLFALTAAALASPLLTSRERAAHAFPKGSPPVNLLAILLFAPFLAWSAWTAFTIPVNFGDELSLWTYKSSVFTETGAFHPSAWTLSASRGPAYPPAFPIAGSVASIFTDTFDPYGCRMVAALGYFAFWALTYELLQMLGFGFFALAGSLAFAAAPISIAQSSRVMADLILTASIALACSEWLAGKLTFASILQIASPCALKLEGLPIAVFMIFAGIVVSKDARGPKRILQFTVALSILAGPWLLYLWSTGFNPLTGQPFGQPMGGAGTPVITNALSEAPAIAGRFAEVAKVIFESLAVSSAFGFAAAGVLVFVAGGAIQPTQTIRRALCFALGVAILTGQFLPLAVAPNFDWQLGVVRDRAAIHIIPAAILLLASLRNLDRQPPVS
ncbi:MAG: hypothetical protein ACKVS6_12615 [Planctomycetota bacterium]